MRRSGIRISEEHRSIDRREMIKSHLFPPIPCRGISGGKDPFSFFLCLKCMCPSWNLTHTVRVYGKIRREDFYFRELRFLIAYELTSPHENALIKPPFSHFSRAAPHRSASGTPGRRPRRRPAAAAAAAAAAARGSPKPKGEGRPRKI